MTARVVERTGARRQRARRLHRAVLVVHRARDAFGQRTARDHLAVAVRERACIDGHRTARGHRAVVIAQCARCIGRQRAACRYRRARRIQVASRRGRADVAVRRRAATGEVDGCTLQIRVTGRRIAASRRDCTGRVHVQVARLRQRAVTVHTRRERAGRIHHARADCRVLLRGKYAAVRQRAGRVQADAPLSVGRPAVVDAVMRRHGDIAARVHLAREFQLALGGQHKVARIRRRDALERNAHTGLGAHQNDTVRVHATKTAHVDGDARRGAVARNRRRVQRAVVDTVCARDDVQVLRVDRRIRLHRTRQQIHLIDV